MSLLKKEDIFKEFGKNKKDSGSTESQIALFSSRIKLLSDHLKNNAKDYNTERSLVKMVGKRRNLLEYLKKNDIEKYRDIIKKLDIRNNNLVWLPLFITQHKNLGINQN